MDWKVALFIIALTVFQLFLPRYLLPKLRHYLETRGQRSGKRTMTGKQIFLFLLVWFAGASGSFYYFWFCDERTVLLECQKETMTCTYSRTTRAKKKLHFVEAYDMNGIETVFLNCHHQKGGGTSCQIALFKSGSEWSGRSFPFALRHDAAEELEKGLNIFLATDRTEYRFYKEK